jgi:hypothetical protein
LVRAVEAEARSDRLLDLARYVEAAVALVRYDDIPAMVW